MNPRKPTILIPSDSSDNLATRMSSTFYIDERISPEATPLSGPRKRPRSPEEIKTDDTTSKPAKICRSKGIYDLNSYYMPASLTFSRLWHSQSMDSLAHAQKNDDSCNKTEIQRPQSQPSKL